MYKSAIKLKDNVVPCTKITFNDEELYKNYSDAYESMLSGEASNISKEENECEAEATIHKNTNEAEDIKYKIISDDNSNNGDENIDEIKNEIDDGPINSTYNNDNVDSCNEIEKNNNSYNNTKNKNDEKNIPENGKTGKNNKKKEIDDTNNGNNDIEKEKEETNMTKNKGESNTENESDDKNANYNNEVDFENENYETNDASKSSRKVDESNFVRPIAKKITFLKEFEAYRLLIKFFEHYLKNIS